MRTNQAVALALVVLLIAGVGMWWAIHDDSEPVPDDAPSRPTVQQMDPVQQRAADHDHPWPFGAEFDEELRAIKSPGPIMDRSSEEYLKWENEFKVHDLEVSVRFENATVPEVVAKLAELAKPRGVRVWAYEDKDIAQMVAENRFTFEVDQRPFWEVIDYIQAHSNARVKYFVTSLGIMIGPEAAVQQVQMDAAAATAKRLAEADRKDPLLDVMYRPDFTLARIGAIGNTIHKQTKIQVVVDEATWKKGRLMTWRDDPMPLRDALEKISEEFGCVFRIRGGRVFLIQP